MIFNNQLSLIFNTVWNKLIDRKDLQYYQILGGKEAEASVLVLVY